MDSSDVISALMRGAIQRQDEYVFSITAFHDISSIDINFVDLMKGKCDWILVDYHSLLLTNTTLKPGELYSVSSPFNSQVFSVT